MLKTIIALADLMLNKFRPQHTACFYIQSIFAVVHEFDYIELGLHCRQIDFHLNTFKNAQL